ncbi:putative glycosyltransferase [Desulfitobacterium dichloroeliminans LMG P-21439]|uniref:Putative glycosyltransferase n=1 Tax=Desulfitobacterium dichloroeliminans (strain LMG P-21439 / DCA1) TaxID=871963 RepID=L0FC86_DESDL|nr:flagellar brake domain-containing protein [Desulfitobacterium dichloroeliminans]AGA70266.1 putative glycosyltransferase [Desulfitobacterium dichloroeliminans LMG P-21439]
MQYLDKLVPGLSVEVHVPEGDYEGNYRTHIDEVGKTRISVYAPQHRGMIIPLHERTPLVVTFWDEVASYAFNTTVIQRIAVPISIFVLEMPESIKRVQRRNYVRVAAFYPLTYQVVERTGLGDLKTGNMLDLSGGGMRFQSKEKLDIGTILFANLELPSYTIGTPGRVCRVVPVEDTSKFAISVDFYQISERDRDRIVRCVFNIQRDLRKKGLV